MQTVTHGYIYYFQFAVINPDSVMPLYLIPTFLSENTNTLSPEALEIARDLDEFVVENEKSARHFLKQIVTRRKQSELRLHLLNEHSGPEEISRLGQLFLGGNDIGLLSEAGCPSVADPGAAFVRMAHDNGVRVIPLTGPSSILLALMASGLNGQSFVFHGYLSREPAVRKNQLLQLEKDAIKKKQTQIFMETPYRNMALLGDILQVCSGDIRLSISCNLTAPDEFIRTRSVSGWKKDLPELNKKPAIFLIGQ
jgi:16S rRNA (cytidine1402-2'-O)-methyltransferase